MHIRSVFGSRWTRHHFSALLQTIAVWLFHGCAFLAPLLFFRGISDGIELPKLLFWMQITLGILLAWLVGAFFSGELRKSPVWIAGSGLLALMAGCVSAWLSQNRFLSIVGVGGEASFSLFAMGTGGLFAFLVLQRLTELHAFRVVRSFFAGAGVAGLFAVFTMLGSSVMTQWLGSTSATFVGNAYVLGVLFATILPGVSIYATYRKTIAHVLSEQEGFASDLLFFGTAVIGAVHLMILGSRTSFSILALGLAVACALIFMHARPLVRTPALIVTIICFCTSVIFSFVTVPWHANIPPEISPNMTLSAMIASKSLAEHRWFGSGPGTWGQIYTQFHPAEVNQFPFWDAVFDRSYNQWLTLFPTLGILGFSAWVLFCLVLLSFAFRAWNEERANPGKAMVLVLMGSLLVAQSFYHLSMPLTVLFWLVAGWICRGALSDTKATVRIHEDSSAFAIPFVVAGIGCASLLCFVIGRITWSQIEMGRGVMVFQQRGASEAIPFIARATSLAPWDPYIARTLGEVHVLRALTTLQGKPTSTVLAQAYRDMGAGVDMMMAVRERLPRDVDTRLLLARTYRSMISVAKDAEKHAIDAYQSATTLHPATPAIPHELGVFYLELGDRDRARSSSATANYAKAKEFFAKALALKTDYLPTRYMMGVVAEREGRMKDAIASLEGVLKAQNKSTGVAFELALLYARAGEALASKTLLEQIVMAEPSNMNARWYLGSLYESAGAKDKAIEQIQWIYDHGFSANASVAQKLQALKVGTSEGKITLPLPLNTTP